MKKKYLLNFFTLAILGFFVSYMIASFANATFDFTKWSTEVRVLIKIVTLLCGLFSIMVKNIEDN